MQTGFYPIEGWWVRTMSDIAALDRCRKEQNRQIEKEERPGNGEGSAAARAVRARSGEPFHNLEEHGYDYDEMVWDKINASTEG